MCVCVCESVRESMNECALRVTKNAANDKI